MVFQVRLIDFFSALEVFYENALYKFTFDIWHSMHELFVLQESTVSDISVFKDMVISLVLETSS